MNGEFNFVGRLVKKPATKIVANGTKMMNLQLAVPDDDAVYLYITVFNDKIMGQLNAVGNKGVQIDCSCEQSNDHYVDQNSKDQWTNSLIMKRVSFLNLTQDQQKRLNQYLDDMPSVEGEPVVFQFQFQLQKVAFRHILNYKNNQRKEILN